MSAAIERRVRSIGHEIVPCPFVGAQVSDALCRYGRPWPVSKLDGAQCPMPGPLPWHVAGIGAWQAIFGQFGVPQTFFTCVSALLYSSIALVLASLTGTLQPHSVMTVSEHLTKPDPPVRSQA